MTLQDISKVYVINLPERKDRLELANAELKSHGIEYTLFEATKNENGVLGLLDTMIRLFDEAISEGHEHILVFEDDVKLLCPFTPFMETVLPQLHTDYHTFYLGLNLLTTPKKISENILLIDQAYSSHAILYSRSGMILTLAALNRERTPYDILLRDHIQVLKKSFCSFPMLATQRISFSSIENKVIDWGQLMATTFSMHTKNLMQMSAEIVYCFPQHTWNGIVPEIDRQRFEWQHSELMGVVCDCKRTVYHEQECGCTVKEWEIKPKENVQ